MPDRKQEADYRYGYQGEYSEKEELGGTHSFELRLWDARIGRWMSPDPYGQFASPYLGMGNIPNMSVDPDGWWAGGCDDPPCDNFNMGGNMVWLEDTVATATSHAGKAQVSEADSNFIDHLNSMVELNHILSLVERELEWQNRPLATGEILPMGGPFDLLGVGEAAFTGVSKFLIEDVGLNQYAATAVVVVASGVKKPKIHKHHLIPKQIWKEFKQALSNPAALLKRDAGYNLKKLPTPFHGSKV